MKKDAKAGFATRAIHAGMRKDSIYGALTAPIYQTSTFIFKDCEQGARRFTCQEDGFIYSRLGNPTVMMLEDKIANLEGAEAGLCFSSGMGAISSVFWTILKAGDHVVADSVLYGCTYALLSHGMSRYGVETTFVDTRDLDALKKAIKPNTKMVYVETPANPTLKIVDLAAIAKLVHGVNKDIKCVVDNTFATPYLQRPIELGFDVTVHSTTKYINGHGDVIAGAACGKLDFITQVRLFGQKDMTGSVLGPQEAFLILRGLKTLEIRMQKHCANAKEVAAFLDKHPKVDKVYYPGLKSHDGYEIAKKQMSDSGGMIAFEVKGGRAAGAQLLNNLELCSLAVSLGDAETLVEHPATMTHSTYTAEELKAAGIPEGLVRLSVGLEDAADIIADLEQGFKHVK